MRIYDHVLIDEKTRDFQNGFDSLDFVQNDNNHAVLFGNDLALFVEGGAGHYGHLFFESRGRQAVDNARRARDYIFNEGTNAIIGITPADKLGALWVAKQIGMKQVGFIRDEYLTVITRQEWLNG